ncbi:MAG: hypothetical protein EYC70_00535 [Planctomycetota bacterium]|nr:MAG: hypothetical protein EYC70_00535 [Planctomycetota bacterium]
MRIRVVGDSCGEGAVGASWPPLFVRGECTDGGRNATAMEEANLQVEWVPIERLSLNPANPRQNDAAVPHVAASLRRFGWRQPIVARPDGNVLAGNTRLKAARELGMAAVPVTWFGGSELEAVAYSIADNRSHEFSAWDQPALAALLQQLRAEDGLDGVGFNAQDLDELLRELGAQPGELDDPGPEAPPANPVTRPGDLWILGEHRLLCGDSTRPEDVARVMAGDVAALLATDPPYCVDYTGNDRPHGGKDWGEAGAWDGADLEHLLDGVLLTLSPHLAPLAPIYVWHAHVQLPAIARLFEKHGAQTVYGNSCVPPAHRRRRRKPRRRRPDLRGRAGSPGVSRGRPGDQLAGAAGRLRRG